MGSDLHYLAKHAKYGGIDTRLALLCVILFAILIVALPGSKTLVTAAVQPQSDGANSISDSASHQIQALMAEKESRMPAQQKIDLQLVYAIKIANPDSITSPVPSLKFESGC